MTKKAANTKSKETKTPKTEQPEVVATEQEVIETEQTEPTQSDETAAPEGAENEAPETQEEDTESKAQTHKPGSIGEARPIFFEYLKTTRNTSQPTLYTYGKDFDIIESFFKSEKLLTKILPANVGLFLKCDALLKKPNGKPRAERTVDKTARVLRLFLIWAVETNRIEKAPLPKDARLGGKSLSEIEQAKKDREAKAVTKQVEAKAKRAVLKAEKAKARAEKAQAEAEKAVEEAAAATSNP